MRRHTRTLLLLIGFLSAVTCQAGTANVLTYDDVLSEAVRQSYDLRLAKIDARLARNDIKQQRVDFFPKIMGQFNSDHLQSLTGLQQQQVQPVAVVGNSILPNMTRFQNALNLNTTYTLFDFGIRNENMRGAKSHFRAAQVAYVQQARDLKLKIIDLYAQALSNYKELKAKEQSLGVYQQLFVLKQRLAQAGTIGKVDVADQAMKVAKTLDEVNEAKQSYAQDLKDLSKYTHLSYDPDDTQLRDLDETPHYIPNFVPEQTPEHKYYQLEINKKEAELKVLGLQRLPQIGFYSYYLFYGYDPYKPWMAVANFGQRTISAGLSVTMPVFDGFKNSADREKKRLEIERLKVEEKQKLWELESTHAKICSDAHQLRYQLSTKATLITSGQEKVGMYQRLAEHKVSDDATVLTQRAELIDHQLRLDKATVQHIASLMKLKVLTES